MSKGQSAIELILILAISMVVLTTIISYSNEAIAGINREKQLKEAQETANEIVSAANDVYHQGPGARKKIFYRIPNGINESKSGIEGKSIVLNVNESDVYASADVLLSGSLPLSSGGHWIWVEAKEGYVSIGSEKVELNKTSIYVSMVQDSNAKKTITVTNNSSKSAQVTIVKTWPHSNVSLVISSSSFSLNAAQETIIDLNFASNASALGAYSGSLQFNICFGNEDQNILVPVTVEVETVSGNLRLFPTSSSLVVLSNDSNSSSFQVCNTDSATISNVSFSTSSSDAGDWIESIASIPLLAGNTCEEKTFTVSVPAGTSPGNYSGTK